MLYELAFRIAKELDNNNALVGDRVEIIRAIVKALEEKGTYVS